MTDLGKLCERIYNSIEWQRFPVGYTDSDKERMILNALIDAIRDMFVVTGRNSEYDNYYFLYEEPSDPDNIPPEDIADDIVHPADTEYPSVYTYTLKLDEEMYVVCKALVGVFGKVRAQYNDLLGYTTNALTVTNADKPYAYITGTISELEADLRRYYYKMVRFSHLG